MGKRFTEQEKYDVCLFIEQCPGKTLKEKFFHAGNWFCKPIGSIQHVYYNEKRRFENAIKHK